METKKHKKYAVYDLDATLFIRTDQKHLIYSQVHQLSEPFFVDCYTYDQTNKKFIPQPREICWINFNKIAKMLQQTQEEDWQIIFLTAGLYRGTHFIETLSQALELNKEDLQKEGITPGEILAIQKRLAKAFFHSPLVDYSYIKRYNIKVPHGHRVENGTMDSCCQQQCINLEFLRHLPKYARLQIIVKMRGLSITNEQSLVFLDDDLNHIRSFANVPQVIAIQATTRTSSVSFYETMSKAITRINLKNKPKEIARIEENKVCNFPGKTYADCKTATSIPFFQKVNNSKEYFPPKKTSAQDLMRRNTL